MHLASKVNLAKRFSENISACACLTVIVEVSYLVHASAAHAITAMSDIY